MDAAMADRVKTPDTVGTRAVGHTKWIVAAPIVTKALGLAGTMVLARLLVPSQFGLMAYAGTALGLFSVFQDLGITQALIAHPGDVGPRLRPALATSLLAGLGFYLLLVGLSWPLALFVGEALLGPVLSVLALVLLLQTAGQVQHALMVRGERYRALFAIACAQATTYVAVAVGLALGGAGVWSLVVGHVAAQSVRTGLLWTLSSWRPGGGTTGRARWFDAALLRFGGALTVVNVLDWAADGWVFFTIGKMLGASALGVYNLSFEAARMAYFGLPALAASVVLTSYGSLLDDPVELRRLMLKGLRVVHNLAFPMAAFIAGLSPWIVPLVWGPRWTEAVPVLAILALLGFAAPAPNVLLPYFVSAGRLGLLMRLTALRLLAYGIGIGVAAGYGLRIVAGTHIFLMCSISGIILLLAARSVGAHAMELVRAIVAPALRAGVSGLAAAGVARALDGRPAAAVLAAALLLGGACYAVLLYATDRPGFWETASVLGRGTGVLSHGR